MASSETVKYFCSGSCENVPAEEPRETGLQYFDPDETSAVPHNLSDERTETGCQYFGGGKCEEVTGWSPVPACFNWTCEDVADWIESIGFPLYRIIKTKRINDKLPGLGAPRLLNPRTAHVYAYDECFASNFVNGRRLILIDASTLPQLGITDFMHIKEITKEIRKLLDIEDVSWNRSITLPPREQRGMFLENKSITGIETDKIAYEKFTEDWSYLKFKPPLCNQALLLPR